jgi:hypothetical protein
MAKVIFRYGDQANDFLFEQNISVKYYPEIDLTQGSVFTADGSQFSFERSKKRRKIYSLTWPVMASNKFKELVLWINTFPNGKLNKFIYIDPEEEQHIVNIFSDTIKFQPIGNTGLYVSGSLELIELEDK